MSSADMLETTFRGTLEHELPVDSFAEFAFESGAKVPGIMKQEIAMYVEGLFGIP